MRPVLAVALVAAVSVGAAVAGRAAGGPSVGPAPDYARAEDWVCRPGAEAACTANLDATAVAADGTTRAEPFVAAADPPIDCFYVYPTVSRETTPYSDLAVTPEVATVTDGQAGRLAARCRLFAPAYRQATLAHLRANLRGDDPGESDAPFDDVSAAWAYYLAHDNGGRGVVLVGHSQGTILLQRLIATAIDGRPAQALLVAAFLAGDPSLGVPPGRTSGGTFAHVPTCAAARQTGCVYAWGSYRADDGSTLRRFGHARADGLVSACVDPAAPAGGTGALLAFRRKAPDAPASDPPWVELVGQLEAVCRADASGDALRVSVVPGRFAAADDATLRAAEIPFGWGLHRLDIGLVQGNLLDLLGAESAAWTATHPRPAASHRPGG